MNSPFVIEQAKLWGATIAGTEGLSIEDKIHRMYLQAFSRTATSEQLDSAKRFLSTQSNEYQIPEAKLPNDARVWADLGHVLINTKAFSYVF